ncbi:MAG: transposase domain-containing protein [Paludibacteraceae bacterium]|nr:transposase domain-containing protein [Prevotellaceae bacterium]
MFPIYSLIASCKAAEVDPREWMTDVLTKLPLYRETSKDLSELLPMNWKISTNVTNS